MATPIPLTRAQATRMMLRWQGLSGAPRFHGREGALAFVRQAGCVQFDPLDPCGRSPELTLHARIHDLTREDLRHLLYAEHRLLDHWDKNMAIVAREDYPRLARRRKTLVAALRQHREIEKAKPAVLEAIRLHGPLDASKLSFQDKVDWWWAPTNIGRATLETLFQAGELVVFDRRGTSRTFDLAGHHLEAELLTGGDGFKSQAAYHAWCVGRRIAAVGLLWDKRSDAYLSIEDLTPEKRSRAFAALARQKQIQPLQVEGIAETLYAPTESLPFLEEGEDDPHRTEIIAPLDSFLWDRKLIKALFDFYYTWEVYTPKEKRQWGYYVMPVLQGNELVGRVEIKRDRSAGLLRVIGAWWERPVDPKGLADCLDRLCAFNDVQGWEAEPGVCMN